MGQSKNKPNFPIFSEDGFQANVKDAQIVILQAPSEHTVSFGKGTSKGPKAILENTRQLEFYDEELDFDNHSLKVHTLKELNPKFSQEQMLDEIYKTSKDLLLKNKFLILLGGEHSISAPIIKAHKEKWKNLSVLQFDAHSDLRDSYEGTKNSHACVMKRVVDMGMKAVQVGIRAVSMEESKLIKEKNLKIFYANEFFNADYENLYKKIISELTDDVYITFDVDVFDPSIMPATGTPAPGGLDWYQVLNLIKEVSKKKKIVGFDIVELAPKKEMEHCNFTAAKLLFKMMNYAFCKKM